jgi:parallel beta-helix repeat protein
MTLTTGEKPSRLPAAAWLAGLALCCSLPAQAACTYTLATDADVTAIADVSLPPGTSVCLAAGTYTRLLTVLGDQGTATAPITVAPVSAKAVVRLQGGVNIRASSYVVLSGMARITAPPEALAAVIIDQGSHHVTVRGNTIEDAHFGVALGTGTYGGLGGPAGVGNLIEDNLIQRHALVGIAVSAGTSGKNKSTGQVEHNRIRLNTVADNGGHGIDLDNAAYASVERNLVRRNGLGDAAGTLGGYSGIHLRSTDPSGKRCTGHLVRWNLVLDTQERPALAACDDTSGSGHCVDGNGIQVDLFCDANEVSYNVVKGNAGSGIHVFTARDNDVHSNTVVGNNRQADRMAFQSPADVGEILVSTAVAGRTSGNRVYDNIAWPDVASVPAVTASASVSGAANRLGPNMLYNTRRNAGWPVFSLAGTVANDATQIDSLTGTTGHLVAKPLFLDIQQPEAEGLQLTAKPAKPGEPPSPLLPDRLGLMPPASQPRYFGAYYK